MNLTISYKADDQGRLYLPREAFNENTNVDRLDLKLVLKEANSRVSLIPKIYPIFRQAAGCYGEYSEYMEHHGCACCSLTTMLAAYSKDHRDLTPDQTISKVEKNLFDTGIWHNNYDKKLKKQMPVTLYGISEILKFYGISNHYIRSFDVDAARYVMRPHLEHGKPIIIETSRIRYQKGKIVSIFDKKYAGSYHTMIILGIEEDRETVWFTDSAYRSWSGEAQRLKRAKLSDLLNYMFTCKNTLSESLYFDGRRNTGGYILVD